MGNLLILTLFVKSFDVCPEPDDVMFALFSNPSCYSILPVSLSATVPESESELKSILTLDGLCGELGTEVDLVGLDLLSLEFRLGMSSFKGC